MADNFHFFLYLFYRRENQLFVQIFSIFFLDPTFLYRKRMQNELKRWMKKRKKNVEKYINEQ